MATLNFSEFDAYAFDFDGTLADSVPAHGRARLQAFDKMAEETGDARYVQISPEVHAEAHRHGSNPSAIIGWALQAAGIVSELDDERVLRTVQLKKDVYRELAMEGLEEIPNATDFLRALESKYPSAIGITTTAHRQEVIPFLRRYKLDGLIGDEKIVTYEDIDPARMKPDPLAYQITLERFGLTQTPEKLLVFEDTPGGVLSTKAAGATAVALCTTHSPEHFNDSPFDYQFADFAELLKLT